MSDLIEGMARAVAAAWFGPAWIKHERQITDEEIAVQKAALLWLADNVSDEMVDVIAHATSGDEFRQRPEEDFNDWVRRLRKAAISAALRAAAREAAQ